MSCFKKAKKNVLLLIGVLSRRTDHINYVGMIHAVHGGGNLQISLYIALEFSMLNGHTPTIREITMPCIVHSIGLHVSF